MPVYPHEWEYGDHQIPADLYANLQWTNKDGHKCHTVLCDRDFINGKRIAIFRESTYVETCAIGALHYYARIEVYGPSIHDETDKSTYWGGSSDDPPFGSLTIQATRILTKVEKDLSDEVIGKIGDSTYRFNTEAEAKEAGIAMFKKRFGPGWVLVPDSWDEGDRPILAET